MIFTKAIDLGPGRTSNAGTRACRFSCSFLSSLLQIGDGSKPTSFAAAKELKRFGDTQDGSKPQHLVVKDALILSFPGPKGRAKTRGPTSRTRPFFINPQNAWYRFLRRGMAEYPPSGISRQGP